jgi:hypothetical protein
MKEDIKKDIQDAARFVRNAAEARSKGNVLHDIRKHEVSDGTTTSMMLEDTTGTFMDPRYAGMFGTQGGALVYRGEQTEEQLQASQESRKAELDAVINKFLQNLQTEQGNSERMHQYSSPRTTTHTPSITTPQTTTTPSSTTGHTTTLPTSTTGHTTTHPETRFHEIAHHTNSATIATALNNILQSCTSGGYMTSTPMQMEQMLVELVGSEINPEQLAAVRRILNLEYGRHNIKADDRSR